MAERLFMLPADRARFDQITTFMTKVFGRQTPETIEELRLAVYKASARKICDKKSTDTAKIYAGLAEIGFWYIVDEILKMQEEVADEAEKLKSERLMEALADCCKSFECHHLSKKPEAEWDEYDTMMAPIWKRAVSLIGKEPADGNE